MKDIIEKNLKIISDYNMQLPSPISYLMRPPALRHPTPIPQNVREALIKLEQVLCDVTRNDSALLQTILSEFGMRLSLGQSFYGTIAHVAAQQNRDSLEVLIDKLGESVLEALDPSGQTVTSHAAKYNTKSLELLIERFGEKVLYVKDSHGDTPLNSAARNNRDSFKFLIEMLHKTDLFTERNYEGSTALHVAIRNGNGDLLKPLIDKHPEITQSFLSEKNIKGNTPLHFAAEYDKDFFAFLMEKFGEQALEVKNNDGATVLHVAAERNKDSLALLIEKFPETIKTLLSEKDAFGRTVLHLVSWHNKESLELLIERFHETVENSLGEPDTGGSTPLHFAAAYHGNALQLLIKKFPEQVKSLFDVENEYGKTVLQYALSDCPDALPKEYQPHQKSCVISGNKESMPIPGLPEAFSSYYQDQVALLLKLRLEDAVPGALKSVNVLEANYTLRETNEDDIATKLSSFILASAKDTILIPLNIAGSHLIGIAAVKDGNNIVIHYMDSELGLPPESLFMKIESILESHSYSMELRIAQVERQKYSNCGPEVIENLNHFVTDTPRVSQEEAVLKHSTVLEKYLLKNSDDGHHPNMSIGTATFSGTSALNDKLIAQLKHYLRTGEVFDSAQSAIEDGTVSIIRQSAVSSNEEVDNSAYLYPIQRYNEDSYHDLEALHHTLDFSQDYTAAILGLLCSFIVSS